MTKALRKLTAAEIPLAMAEEIAEPVLVEMRSSIAKKAGGGNRLEPRTGVPWRGRSLA